jgi:hypothetical protein
LQLCQKAGLVKLGHVAIDGNKLQANANEQKAMGYGRMTETEQRVREEIEELLRRAQESMLRKICSTARGIEATSCRRNWLAARAV